MPEFVAAHWRRAAAVAAVAVAAVAVAVATWLLVRPADEPMVDEVARADAEEVADLAAGDLAAALDRVADDPDWHVRYEDDAALTATLARAGDDGACYALRIRVDGSWLSTGDADAVNVGEIRDDPGACGRAVDGGDADPVSR